jgi:hypothetical protein
LLVGKTEHNTVGVVNNGDLVELKQHVQDDDISESMADVSAGIAVDDDFCLQSLLLSSFSHPSSLLTSDVEVEIFLWDASRICAGYWRQIPVKNPNPQRNWKDFG